jgi:hypothetical protein
MYGKIFTQIYEGTLASKGPWQALVTFQQLIVLANKYGEIDMTPEAIANRTTIPLDIIKAGIAELEKPDPDSRTAAEEGRRIVRLSDSRTWGWRLVNHEKYRKIRSEDERREYMRDLMRNKRAKGGAVSSSVSNVSSPLAPVSDVSPCGKQYAEALKTKSCPNPSGSDGCLSLESEPKQPEKIADAVASESRQHADAVVRVWEHYVLKLNKNPKLFAFTALRKRKGLARFRECLAKTNGDAAKAEGLLKLAVDALAASAFHRGDNDRATKYDSWEAHLFPSQEKLEYWIERA